MALSGYWVPKATTEKGSRRFPSLILTVVPLGEVTSTKSFVPNQWGTTVPPWTQGKVGWQKPHRTKRQRSRRWQDNQDSRAKKVEIVMFACVSASAKYCVCLGACPFPRNDKRKYGRETGKDSSQNACSTSVRKPASNAYHLPAPTSHTRTRLASFPVRPRKNIRRLSSHPPPHKGAPYYSAGSRIGKLRSSLTAASTL